MNLVLPSHIYHPERDRHIWRSRPEKSIFLITWKIFPKPSMSYTELDYFFPESTLTSDSNIDKPYEMHGVERQRDCIPRNYWEVVPNLPMPVLSKAGRIFPKPSHCQPGESPVWTKSLIIGLHVNAYGGKSSEWMYQVCGRAGSGQYLTLLKGTGASQSL